MEKTAVRRLQQHHKNQKCFFKTAKQFVPQDNLHQIDTDKHRQIWKKELCLQIVNNKVICEQKSLGFQIFPCQQIQPSTFIPAKPIKLSPAPHIGQTCFQQLSRLQRQLPIAFHVSQGVPEAALYQREVRRGLNSLCPIWQAKSGSCQAALSIKTGPGNVNPTARFNLHGQAVIRKRATSKIDKQADSTRERERDDRGGRVTRKKTFAAALRWKWSS